MSFYDILGVSPSSSQEEIKSAYKKLVKQHHPDLGGDETHFKKINEAYETLSDPVKRSQYDNPSSYHQNSHPFRNSQEFHFSSQNFDPFDDDFFRRYMNRRRQGFEARNKDIRVAITLTLEDVITGKEFVVNFGEETATINIPPGVLHGETIQYKGLGDNTYPELPRGNLIVIVNLDRHKVFDREGLNLRIIKSVNTLDLLLGTRIEVKTLDGSDISVNIPAGTNPGTILNVARHGLPNHKTGESGNLLIVIKGITPKIKDPKLLEQLEKIKNEISNST